MTYFTKMAISSNSYLYLCNFNLPYSDIQLSAKAASCFKVKEDLDLKEAFGFCGLINFRETAASTINEQNSVLGFSIKSQQAEKNFQMHFSNEVTKTTLWLMYLISITIPKSHRKFFLPCTSTLAHKIRLKSLTRIYIFLSIFLPHYSFQYFPFWLGLESTPYKSSGIATWATSITRV